MARGLKLKVRKFLRLIFKFVENTGEKLVGGGGRLSAPILNMVKVKCLVVEGHSAINHLINITIKKAQDHLQLSF